MLVEHKTTREAPGLPSPLPPTQPHTYNQTVRAGKGVGLRRVQCIEGRALKQVLSHGGCAVPRVLEAVKRETLLSPTAAATPRDPGIEAWDFDYTVPPFSGRDMLYLSRGQN